EESSPRASGIYLIVRSRCPSQTGDEAQERAHVAPGSPIAVPDVAAQHRGRVRERQRTELTEEVTRCWKTYLALARRAPRHNHKPRRDLSREGPGLARSLNEGEAESLEQEDSDGT